MSLVLAVLVASVFGSLHCAGMCGPLVAFAVGDPQTRSGMGRALLHVAYHGGRCVSYVVVGLLCGTAGAVLDLGGSLIGVYRGAAILAGGLMIGTGIIGVLRYSGVRWPALPAAHWAQRLTAGASSRVGVRTVTTSRRDRTAHRSAALRLALPVCRRGGRDR